MRELLNVLYVLTQGAVLHLDADTVRISVEGETTLRVPLLRLNGIVVFGQVTLTPFLIQRCAADGRLLVWMQRNGRFAARAEGPMRGNVLLRRAQHLALSDPEQPGRVARQIVAAKIQNSRRLLQRAARDAREPTHREPLQQAGGALAEILTRLKAVTDLNAVRGHEGDAARTYFGVFGHMLRGQPDDFGFDGRTRRPPRDRTNAVLSFLYALLRNECAGAARGRGAGSASGLPARTTARPARPGAGPDGRAAVGGGRQVDLDPHQPAPAAGQALSRSAGRGRALDR